MNKTEENIITINGKRYYMIADFAKLISKKPNAVYQMIHRGTIPEKYTIKLHKIVFISENMLIDINNKFAYSI